MRGLKQRRPANSRLAIARTLLAAAALLGLLGASGCDAAQPLWTIPGADAQRGKALIEPYGCAGCHAVPGVARARGNVGPPLDRFAERIYIAGMLRNQPDNLVRWLRHPQSVVPGNAMPDTGLTEAQARDLAAFLYTLR